MKFGSVCSGIEAASTAFKKCAKCGEVKDLTEFHKHPGGLLCHACNIALGHVERVGFLTSALDYLNRHKDQSCAS